MRKGRARAKEVDEARAKRFLASTKNAIPWIAMQFGCAMLYRNYVARTLLNAQIKSTMMAKFRAAALTTVRMGSVLDGVRETRMLLGPKDKNFQVNVLLFMVYR